MCVESMFSPVKSFSKWDIMFPCELGDFEGSVEGLAKISGALRRSLGAVKLQCPTMKLFRSEE